jgi:hypothetical protein
MNTYLIDALDIRAELIDGVNIMGFLDPNKFKEIEKFYKHNLSATLKPEIVTEEIKRQLSLDALIELDYVPSILHPLSLVIKANGNPRLCIDMSRGINRTAHDIKFTFPKGTDVLRNAFINKAEGAEIIDLKDGFFHVLLSKESYKYCAFTWGGKYYSYKRLPFGFKLSPLIFQKFLEKIIKNFWARNYMDDIIVFKKNDALNIRKLLKKLGLVINEEKSKPFSRVNSWVGYDFRFKNTGIEWFINKERLSQFKNKVMKNRNNPKVNNMIASTLNFYDLMIPKLRIYKYDWYGRNNKRLKFSHSLWKKTWRILNQNYMDNLIKDYRNIIISDASNKTIAAIKITNKDRQLIFSKIQVQPVNENLHIAIKEAMAVSLIKTKGNTLIISDNKTVTNIITSGKSKIPFFQKWVRGLNKKKRVLTSVLVSSKGNHIIDKYSRLDVWRAVKITIDPEEKKKLSHLIKETLIQIRKFRLFANNNQNITVKNDPDLAFRGIPILSFSENFRQNEKFSESFCMT